CRRRLEIFRARNPFLAAGRIFLLRREPGHRPGRCRRAERRRGRRDETCRRGLSPFEVVPRRHVHSRPRAGELGREGLSQRRRSEAGSETIAGIGALEQGGFVSVQGLRRLFTGGRRVSVSRVAMRQEPAQRSLRRYARRPLRSGRLWRLHLAARLGTAQTRRPRGGTPGSRARRAKSGTARHLGVGGILARPRLPPTTTPPKSASTRSLSPA